MLPADVVRVEYVAPATCPSSGDFASQVGDRAPNVRFADAGARARTLIVRIDARGNGYHGSLELRELDGSQTERSLEAATCSQLVTGLALIAALAVDSKSSEATTATQAADSKDPSGTDATSKKSDSPTSDPKSPIKTEGKSKDDPKPKTTRNSDSDSDAQHDGVIKPVGAPHTFELSLGIDGGAIGGVSPNVLPTLPVFIEVGRGPGHGLFTPSVRFRFERPGGDADSSDSGSAHFTWTEGSVDLCPIAYSPIARFRLVPCVRAEAGVVSASGVNANPSRDETRPWFVLGLVGRGRATIYGPLFAELEGALLVPVLRDRFYLEPDTTLFRASPIAWGGAVGLGVTIW